MMRKNRFKLYISIFLILLCSKLSADSSWVIGAVHFDSNNPDSRILNAIGDSMPSLILNNLGNSLNREILPDEKYERKNYELQKDRLSLFLQLSAEYKKRDNLVLYDYSPKQLAKKIKEEDKKIEELEEKIQANLDENEAAKAEAEKNQQLIDSGKYTSRDISTEGKKWLYLFKNLFVKNEALISEETITFYKDDVSKLFTPGEAALKEGIESYAYQKEVYSAKINTLLTGKITSYGDYISVNTEAWLFPGGKKIAGVMEVGSLRELDLIAANTAGKLVSAITNSMPVQLEISVLPETAKNVKFYFNDDLQTLTKEGLRVESGVSTFQIQADGYKSISSTYNFEGNRRYSIEVQLEPSEESSVYLMTRNNSELSILANGLNTAKTDENHSRIKINGQTVLGQLVDKEGLSAFYYIPAGKGQDGAVVKVNPKLRNSSDYIEKRRKWMYGSYSALLVSLIPEFICKGEYNNYLGIYTSFQTDENYLNAKKWAVASDVSAGICIGCGIWFGYELIRYLIAGDSILPKKAKKTNINYVEQNIQGAVSEDPENNDETSEAEAPGIENIEE